MTSVGNTYLSAKASAKRVIMSVMVDGMIDFDDQKDQLPAMLQMGVSDSMTVCGSHMSAEPQSDHAIHCVAAVCCIPGPVYAA